MIADLILTNTHQKEYTIQSGVTTFPTENLL